jgi:NAD-dependent dihydropyrimidine dehydrogenase PreA subunit
MFIRNDLCDLCGSCVAVCPVDAISIEEFSAAIAEDICTKCGNCRIVCPARAVFEQEES